MFDKILRLLMPLHNPRDRMSQHQIETTWHGLFAHESAHVGQRTQAGNENKHNAAAKSHVDQLRTPMVGTGEHKSFCKSWGRT